MTKKSIFFSLLFLCLFFQVVQSQSVDEPETIDNKQSHRSAEDLTTIRSKAERKLQRIQKKQAKLLQKIKQADSLHLATKHLKKLEAQNTKIKALEDELAVTKIDKDKLLNDISKDENIAPYLKEYASNKQVLTNKKPEEVLTTANNELLKNEELENALKESDKLKGLSLDSANIVNKGKELGLEELKKQEEVVALKKELAPYLDSPYLKGYSLKDLDSLNVDSLKSIAKKTFDNLEKELEAELSKREEVIAFKSELAKMKEFENLPANYKNQFEQYTDKEYLKSEGVSRAVKEASKYLAEHQDQLADAQKQLAKLKKKYSSVPNSNDLSTATKRNSLKGKPFKERMVFGTNLQLVSTEPFIIDLSPVLGYKIDKKFRVAIGATYRARFTEYPQNKIPPTGKDDLTYGYRSFADYTFWKGFYAHGEYERISKEFEIGTNTDQYERKWKEAAMLGIGRSYTINDIVKGGVQLMYNFLNDNNEKVYTSPWVFRFGFELK